jgi:hypothetical protein
MSTLPPALQKSIEKNAQLAEWRASQKVLNKAAAEEEEKKTAVQKEKAAAAENASPVVKLRKDGTPMKKRGPKPKKEIKVEGGIKKEKVESEWVDIFRNSAEDVLEFIFNVYTRNNELSDDFLTHLTKTVAKERRARKKLLADCEPSK